MDKSTFRQLFTEFYNPLANFARNIVGDEYAEDVVQDVFLKIWNHKEKINLESPKSFLFRSVYNRCIEKIRQKHVESEYLSALKMSQDTELLIEDVADTFMLKERINKSLRQLPSKSRQVFVMAKLNGLTYPEIADDLDISIKTVENHMYKAFRLLRKLL